MLAQVNMPRGSAGHQGRQFSSPFMTQHIEAGCESELRDFLCFDNSYQIEGFENRDGLIDEFEVDFTNFPWLPDFDHQPAHVNPNQYQNNQQSEYSNLGSLQSVVIKEEDTTSGSLVSSDSCSSFRSESGEVDGFAKKSLKRKEVEESILEGDFDRRERNRLNAKKARLRKKQLLGSLQGQLALLKGENSKLRRVIAARMPEKSIILLNKSAVLAKLLTAAVNAP